jgi:hypothetical protein
LKIKILEITGSEKEERRRSPSYNQNYNMFYEYERIEEKSATGGSI